MIEIFLSFTQGIIAVNGRGWAPCQTMVLWLLLFFKKSISGFLLPCVLVMPLPSRARNAYVTTYCRQLSDHKLSKLVFVVVPSRQVSGKLFPSQRLSELIFAKAAESIFPALARPSLRAVSLMSPVYIWAPTEGFVGPLVHLRGFELARPSPFSPAPGG